MLELTVVLTSLWTLVAVPTVNEKESIHRSANLGIALRIIDSCHSIPTGLSATRAQVERRFADLGVTVRWLDSPVEVVESGVPALVVHLRPSRPEEIRLDRRVMAAVLDPTNPRRYIYVFVPRIAENLGIRLSTMMSVEEERQLARALSRVILHEVFHAVAPELPHAHTGLTQAELSRDALIGSRPRVEPNAAEVFRVELAKLQAFPDPAGARRQGRIFENAPVR